MRNIYKTLPFGIESGMEYASWIITANMNVFLEKAALTEFLIIASNNKNVKRFVKMSKYILDTDGMQFHSLLYLYVLIIAESSVKEKVYLTK